MSLNTNRDWSLPLPRSEPARRRSLSPVVLVPKKPIKRVAGFLWDSERHPVIVETFVTPSLAFTRRMRFGASVREERHPAWRFSFRAQPDRPADVPSVSMRSAGVRMPGRLSRGRAPLAPLRLPLLELGDCEFFDSRKCLTIRRA